MAENVYLKTVNFGGFDKKETLTYIDTLLSDIYRLEAEVKEKDEMISSLESGEVQNFSGKEELEARLDEGKSKISELQASNDTLKLQVANYESDVTEKDEKIVKLQSEIEDLKEKLENAEANAGSGGGTADFDLGSVFIEAKKTADKVVVEAKKAAKKMEDDAKELQNQILEDANTQAASIIENANAQAEITTSSANAQAESTVSKANAEAAATITNAKNEAATIREKSADLRNSVKAEYTALQSNITKLSDTFRELFGENMVKIDNTKELVEEGLGLVNGNSNFNYDVKGSGVSEKKHNNNTIKNSDYTEVKAPEAAVKAKPAEKIKPAERVVVEEVKIPEPEPVEEKIEEIKVSQKVEIPEPVDEIERITEEAPAEPERKTEEKIGYSDDDVAKAQEYLAKLLADAEAEAEAELADMEETEAKTPAEEAPLPSKASETEKKPATYSKSFDLDMLSALTKEIEANAGTDRKLSDEEFLAQWKNK